MYTGGELSPEEQLQYINLPRVAGDLLKNIPRMEPIAVDDRATRTKSCRTIGTSARVNYADVRLGAQIIRAALNFDALLAQRPFPGGSRPLSHQDLPRPGQENSSRPLLELEPEKSPDGARNLPISRLANGMILDQRCPH